MKEENETIIKALNMYGRVPEQWELLNEIERLNNIINKAIEYIETQIEDDYDYFGLRYHNDEKDKLLDILKGDDKE